MCEDNLCPLIIRFASGKKKAEIAFRKQTNCICALEHIGDFGALVDWLNKILSIFQCLDSRQLRNERTLRAHCIILFSVIKNANTWRFFRSLRELPSNKHHHHQVNHWLYQCWRTIIVVIINGEDLGDISANSLKFCRICIWYVNGYEREKEYTISFACFFFRFVRLM